MKRQKHLLEIKNLKTWFHTFEGTAKAVDDVSLYLDKNEVLGIVGESGCGKSVTAQSIMRLIPEPPGEIVNGSILFDNLDLTQLSMDKMRTIRGDRIAMIFQEPMSSLNPVFTIGDQIGEMFMLHMKLSRKEALQNAEQMLVKVQIPAPDKRIHEFPHQLSGGMRQRVMIAMALSCNPEILIADEPTTALDVTVQAQIIDLMMQIKEDFNAAIMLITHDLGVISETADRVIVMYAGEVVEEASTEQLFDSPKHPYTQGLLKSVPRPGMREKAGRNRLQEIPGLVPSLYNLPVGCNFSPRCKNATDICRNKKPQLSTINGGRKTRCWLWDKLCC
jgi:oligopeptide/dipeptide ABC transporter ATP-binding protein